MTIIQDITMPTQATPSEQPPNIGQGSEQTDPNKPKKKGRKLKIIIFIIVLLLLIPSIALGSLFYYLESLVNRDPINPDKTEEIIFLIESGQSAYSIGKNLFEENITPNQYVFYYYVRTRSLASKLKAGEYSINPGETTLESIVDLFTHGEIEDDKIKITIPEGYTTKQIDEKLAQTNLENYKQGDLLKIANYKGEEADNRTPEQQELYQKFKNKYWFLQEQPQTKYEGLEGYLFPDTYIYKKDASLETIIDKMLANFDKKLTQDLKDSIKAQNKNLHETIILASIVQRESGRDLETDKRIAGVFTNRLKENIALYSCSTLQYISETNKFQYTEEEKNIESPYNTYKYAGLPPGPIANPGIISIQASISPEEHEYYYFLNTSSGEFIWSKTYEEHLKAKSKYL